MAKKMRERAKVTLSIDQRVWNEFKSEVKRVGYPRGVASMLFQRALWDAIKSMKERDMAPQIELASWEPEEDRIVELASGEPPSEG